MIFYIRIIEFPIFSTESSLTYYIEFKENIDIDNHMFPSSFYKSTNDRKYTYEKLPIMAKRFEVLHRFMHRLSEDVFLRVIMKYVKITHCVTV